MNQPFSKAFYLSSGFVVVCLCALPVSAVVGSLVALFLWALDLVTNIRYQRPWLLFLLPIAGIAIHFLYKLWGKTAEAGNALIIDEIHTPGAGVPPRMAPLVLITTIITHLFGGSAGREGTAVQMGGSMAALLGRWFALPTDALRLLLMAGVAAGFGAVFGTPLTAAIFALEVISITHIRYRALAPCLIAGYAGDQVCTAWGIRHTSYTIAFAPDHLLGVFGLPSSVGLLGVVVLAGAASGVVAYIFIHLVHGIKRAGNKLFKKQLWLMPVVGGLCVVALTMALHTTDYLGLGVTDRGGVSIVGAFHPGGAGRWSWALKLLFTAITIGSGFKGGEVTPLFFIGATLGAAIAATLGVPTDLLAGIGFIAVFAGAANTPFACTIMGMELFGPTHLIYFAIACFVAYYSSGKQSIYSSKLPK